MLLLVFHASGVRPVQSYCWRFIPWVFMGPFLGRLIMGGDNNECFLRACFTLQFLSDSYGTPMVYPGTPVGLPGTRFSDGISTEFPFGTPREHHMSPIIRWNSHERLIGVPYDSHTGNPWGHDETPLGLAWEEHGSTTEALNAHYNGYMEHHGNPLGITREQQWDTM